VGQVGTTHRLVRRSFILAVSSAMTQGGISFRGDGVSVGKGAGSEGRTEACGTFSSQG